MSHAADSLARTQRAIVWRAWAWRLALALLGALWPARSWAAGCGPLDLGACVDGAEYSLYAGVAGMGWTIDRTLLQLAYQLDQFRWWLVQVAFTTAYQQLTRVVSPLYVPVTTVALTIACLLYMLVPFTGRVFVSIRQVIIWAILTPILLTVSGQLVAQAETIRVSIGASLFAEASASAPGAIFGVGATDMAAPQALYPANPCGTGQLQRQTGPEQLHMDDLAAALLYASAGDIHCPDRQGPGANLPDRFYDADPGFATAQYVSEMVTVNDRRAAVDGMKDGAIRLWIGILPCILAVCEMLVHLVFALSLAVVWVSLPLGLIFISFQPAAAGVASLLRRVFAVLQTSWSSSFVMGLLFSALLAAASLGNAAAYTGFSIAGTLLTGYLALIAFSTLRDSLRAVSAVVESGTGLALRPAAEVVGAATTGTLATAAIGALAGRTGNAAYAASAVLGRLPGMMELGEVAVGMGWMRDDDDAYLGMRAGSDSRRSWRWARQTIERDAAAFDDQREADRPDRSSPSATSSGDLGTTTWAPDPAPARSRTVTTTNLRAEETALAPANPAPVMRRGETETIVIEGEIVDAPGPRRVIAPMAPRRHLGAADQPDPARDHGPDAASAEQPGDPGAWERDLPATPGDGLDPAEPADEPRAETHAPVAPLDEAHAAESQADTRLAVPAPVVVADPTPEAAALAAPTSETSAPVVAPDVADPGNRSAGEPAAATTSETPAPVAELATAADAVSVQAAADALCSAAEEVRTEAHAITPPSEPVPVTTEATALDEHASTPQQPHGASESSAAPAELPLTLPPSMPTDDDDKERTG